jgi:hypothetical protein
MPVKIRKNTWQLKLRFLDLEMKTKTTKKD